MSLLDREDSKWLLPRFAVVLGLVFMCYLVVYVGLKMFNESLGLERGEEKDAGSEAPPDTAETVYMPVAPALPDSVELPEGPEASWEVTPCSLWVPGSDTPLPDSLPVAPEIRLKPLETLLLVELWAESTGISGEDLEKVYVFNRMDTLYVDMPVEWDVETLKRTLESRFICFTRMFPLVSGNLMHGYRDGLPLRGVEGVFRR